MLMQFPFNSLKFLEHVKQLEDEQLLHPFSHAAQYVPALITGRYPSEHLKQLVELVQYSQNSRHGEQLSPFFQ